uniref:Uncharacterized protein n=1 Tax=Felis catus TaxID=9685 RepID=A0ABI7VQU3_FELCA
MHSRVQRDFAASGCKADPPFPRAECLWAGLLLPQHSADWNRTWESCKKGCGNSTRGTGIRGSRTSVGQREKPDVKVNSSKKKAVIPQIIITKASQETLTSYGSIRSEEQRTIQEQAEWGPYYRHRNPSTVDAYGLRE